MGVGFALGFALFGIGHAATLTAQSPDDGGPSRVLAEQDGASGGKQDPHGTLPEC